MDEVDVAMLEIEARFWRHAGAKEAAIRDRTRLTPVAAYQRLNRLIDNPPPEALVRFGPLIKRLRSVRDTRVRQRVSRAS